MVPFRRSFVFLSACLLCGPLFGQTPNSTPTQPPSIIRMTTQEVVLDLVIRDKKGHLVRDLKPDEIAVYEDGVKQKVNSFRNVDGREQLEAERTAARLPANSTITAHGIKTLPGLTFVSIVFAPMAPRNLNFAREAVLAFLKTDSLPNTYVTIFRLDNRLQVLQPYSQDVALLTRAANEATKILSKHAENPAATVLSTQAASASLASASATGGPGSGNPMTQPSLQVTDPTFQRYAATLDASTSVGAATQAEAALQSRLRFVDNYVTGMTMIDSLRELVDSQRRLQGRKVVLYLSDGLTVPAELPDLFEKLISDANRSGVTFYTVDTRGLSDMSPLAGSIAQMNQATADRSLQGAAARGSLTGAENIAGNFDAASTSSDVQLLAGSNTQLALQELAVRTGGSATANTNEIARPMQRVMESIRTHYELSYTPSSEVYDGHFRKISVKIDRPKTNVETRRGYYALPELNGEPLEPYDLAALKAINARPMAQTFPYETALMEFRPGQSAVQCEIAFEIPLSSLSIQADTKTGKSRLDATVFALVQDAQGQVIDKVSRELHREIFTAQLAALKGEKIEYAELIELAPGHYTISTVVSDQNMERTTVKRFSAYVEPLGHLRLSSVGAVKRVDALRAPRDPADPLEMDGQRVTLTLADSIPSGKPIPLYFVVYPASASASDALKLTVQLLRDGKEVEKSSRLLPKPDSTGSIPIVTQFEPSPGTYALRMTVQQGASIAQTSYALTVK